MGLMGLVEGCAGSTTACIYRGDGRCVGTITRERLTTLRQLYDRENELGYHSTMTPPPRSFEAEMVDLIIRYKPRKNHIVNGASPHPLGTASTSTSHHTQSGSPPPSQRQTYAHPIGATTNDIGYLEHTQGAKSTSGLGSPTPSSPRMPPQLTKLSTGLCGQPRTHPSPLPLSCPSPEV